MIIFRADGNSQIGTGHIMRCLSIADAARESGEESLFIVSDEKCLKLIESRGHNCIVLDSDYLKMKSDELYPFIDTYKPSAIIVDSYYVVDEYMKALQIKCDKDTKLVYIDDRCIYPYFCDVLINYNVFGNEQDYIKLYGSNKNVKFLIGIKYAPLRSEFQFCKRVQKSKSNKILISTGGADAEHFTIDLIEEAKKYSKYSFDIVVGMMNPDGDIINNKTAGIDNIVIRKNVKKMHELMISCDVAISASGSTLYELCATQTPTITYILADNQIPAAEEFNKRGLIKNCGDIRVKGKKIMAKEVIEEAIKLAENFELRKKIADKMSVLVDGKGASRIIDVITGCGQR